jgi:ferredoxin
MNNVVRLKDQAWEFVCIQDQTILLAAQHNGIRLANSCRNGTCRTCICKLYSGAVRYTVEWPGLSKEEKEEGYILPCVAIPISDVEIGQESAFRISCNDAL